MPYHPILDLVRRYLDTPEDITGQQIQSRVVQRLQPLGLDGAERALLLAHSLGASTPSEFLNRFAGAQLKERTFDLLRDMFLRASASAPMVLVVENVHWIDAISEEFLAHL